MAESGIDNLFPSSYDTPNSDSEETKAPRMHSHWKQQAVSG